MRHISGSQLPSSRLTVLAAVLPLILLAPNALAGQAASTPAETPTLRTTAKLVVVDVVVTDASGHAVRGLKQEAFSLSEGKSPQTIRNFEEHAAIDPKVKYPEMPKPPEGVFSNYTSAPMNSAVNVLLLDALNTPTKDQAVVRQEMLKYLKGMKPGTRMAIFGLSSRLLMLQGFSSDPELLKRALDTKRVSASPLLNDPSGARGVEESLSDQLADLGVDSSFITNLATFEAQVTAFQVQSRAQITLDAMNQLARYLSGIPGRKNLIWFSGSFPVNLLPDPENGGDPFASVASAEHEFRETTNLLGHSQVSVYPIDARGLMTSPTMSAATDGAQFAGSNPQRFLKAERDFSTATFNEHSTMQEMAAATGGKAFVDTNGLALAVAAAVDAGSNYYTLAYTPSDSRWNGSFRGIHVKVAAADGRSSYNLAFRQGYYADDPERSRSAATAPATPSALHTAAMYGAPPATQILFKTIAQPATKLPEDAPAAGNSPGKDPKDPTRAIAHGPWIRYLVRYAVDGRPIGLVPKPDGSYHGEIQFITLVYDRDGVLVNSQMNVIQPALNAAQYANLQSHPIGYGQYISVPIKGEYSLRILINDTVSSNLGALEIPVRAVRDLPAAEAPKPTVPPTP